LLKNQPLEVFEEQKSNSTLPYQVCNTQNVDLVSILSSSNLLTEPTKEQSLNDLVQALKRKKLPKDYPSLKDEVKKLKITVDDEKEWGSDYCQVQTSTKVSNRD